MPAPNLHHRICLHGGRRANRGRARVLHRPGGRRVSVMSRKNDNAEAVYELAAPPSSTTRTLPPKGIAHVVGILLDRIDELERRLARDPR